MERLKARGEKIALAETGNMSETGRKLSRNLGTLWLCQISHGKWPSIVIVDLPIENGEFP